ncbi:mucoidy inhibitor A [Ceratobasidium sp. AG-Ba]|nr:mucoidy inhibitor A [Ceratobasidium sp. AG-Ba]
MVVRSAEVVSTGVLSATFGISGHSNIPSDEGSHKVVIAVLDLAAELEWICIPREKEGILRAKIVNTSEFTLLPGEASVFMDNNFHVAPSDCFKTSLGVDPALRVTYPTIRTLNRKTDHARFFSTKDSKQSVVAHSQRISIRNSLNVFSPEGLGPVIDDTEDAKENKGRSWKSVQNGVKARWADLDVGGEGTVEWVCDVQPNTELQLDLAWEVSGPAGLRWETL